MITSPEALIEEALRASTADDCLVVLRVSSTANLRWANNTLTTNGLITAIAVTVVAIVGAAEGMAAGVVTRAASSASQIRSLVADAEAAARLAAPADDAQPLVQAPPDADFRAPATVASIDHLSAFADGLAAGLSRAQRRGQLLYGYVEHDVTTTYLASTAGLRRRFEQPTARVTMTAKPRDLSSSAWVGASGGNLAEFDVEALTAELTRRLGWASRQRELPAGRYPTILPPAAVADVMTSAYDAINGRDAFEGQTVFSHPGGGTRMGEQVAAPGVSMRSDPDAPGLHARPFLTATSTTASQSVFDNGLPLQPTDWIRDGQLTALAASRYTAAMTALAPTPYIDNLIVSVDGASGTVEDLVAGVDQALLLTCLWYIRKVDPQTLLLTGLTRDGVYLVERGEVVGAVNNFRFNESPIDLLNRFTAAGTTRRSFSREWGEAFPRIATPPLLVPDFNMSSVSQAS